MRNSGRASVWSLASCLLSAPLVAAAPATPAPSAGLAKVLTVEGITEYRLGNGLKVLLFPDASKPTVTVNVTYIVGSRHEGYGETGMAHLLEHMLFKGTPRIPNVWKALEDHGAKFNGTTWWDRTNYYEELPASPENLEFALRLEADRMVNSKIAEDDLKKEFSVVRNEFEMGENNPTDVLEEKMLAAAFQWHNYGKTTIGSRSDIERVPVDNLRAFYRRYYQPDNAILIVAGKFDERQTHALITKYFAPIPRPARKLMGTWTEEPVQDGERAVTLRRTGDVAVVSLMFHGVAGPDPDWLGQDAITDILTNKPSGRLYKVLVDKGLASEVYGNVYPTAEPGVILLGAKVRPGGSPDKVREVMIRTIEALAKGKPAATSAEVERWRTKTLKEFELAMTDTSRLGVALSDWAAMGDWRLFFLTRDRAKSVTAADVQRVAGAYLKDSNRTVGMFLPTKNPDLSPAGKTLDVAAMLKAFKGSAGVQQGEAFVATTDNVDKRTNRTVLAGGLNLGLLPKKNKGGAVHLVLTLRYGDEKELKGKSAAAYVLPQMTMRGTKRRSYQQIKDEFDRLKAEVSFGGGRFAAPAPGVAVVRIKTVRDSLPAVLGLLSEVLREPAFPKAQFETLRKEILAKLEEQLQDPMANAFTTLFQRVSPWPRDDVRYIPSIKENVDRIKKLSVADLAKLHKRLWGASAAQLAIVGDFDPSATKTLVEKELGAWKSPKPYERVTQPYREGQTGEEAIDTPNKEMALVAVGHPLELRDDDPEYPALVMVDYLLGGSGGSRLLVRLRQQEGISYGAFSGINARAQDRSGHFFAAALCAPQNADKAMASIAEEIGKMLKDGIGEKELADAKKSYALGFENKLAEDDFVAGELAKGLYLGRTFEYWKTVNDRIQKLTVADVNAAARKYVQPAKLVKIKAGDLSKKS